MRIQATTDLPITKNNLKSTPLFVIAHGTGKDITPQTHAVTAFSQRSANELRQFGITAKKTTGARIQCARISISQLSQKTGALRENTIDEII